MRSFLLSCLIVCTLFALSGCQWVVMYYATNTLDEPCTIRITFSNNQRMHYKKEIRYGNIVIKKVSRSTYSQLNDTLHVKKLNDTGIELILPPKSTAIIDANSNMSQSMDSIYFKNSRKTAAYSRASYLRVQKSSGGPFSGLTESRLYTIK